MNRQEFKQKMNVIKQKMEKIKSELEDCEAYIYNQHDFRYFHSQVTEHLERITYILDNCDARNTSDTFHENSYKEFNNLMMFDINKWNKLKAIKFIPPRSLGL